MRTNGKGLGTAIELSIIGMFQPQRGGISKGVKQKKTSAPSGAAWKPDMPPRWGFFVLKSFTINMPLLTELVSQRSSEQLSAR